MTPPVSTLQPGGTPEVQRLRRALLTLEARLKESPRNPEIALALAETLLRLSLRAEDAGKQVAYLTRACVLDPYDSHLRLQLGLAWQRKGDFAAALPALQAATALNPRNARAFYCLGRLHLEQLRSGLRVKAEQVKAGKAKLEDLALAAFERALAIEPHFVAAALGKLEAMCFARTTAPDKSRLSGLLPQLLSAITPAAEWLPRVVCVSLCAAFAIHYPRHLPTKKLAQEDQQRAQDRAARRKLYDALLRSLAPWQRAFPEDSGLAMIAAVIAILDAEDEALAERTAAVAEHIREPRILHLFVHQRIEEIREPAHRAEILASMAQRFPLRSGLERELLSAMNTAARMALLADEPEKAEKWWRRGLQTDPYCLAFHHNLTLLALSRRDPAALATHLGNTVELLLLYWQLAPQGKRYLERLAACHESFSGKLRVKVSQMLTGTEATQQDGELLLAWLRETQAALALRAVLLTQQTSPAAEVGEAVVRYLRDLMALAAPAVPVPTALQTLLDPQLSRPAPLHYEALGVAAAAPPSELRKRHQQAVEELTRIMQQARLQGDREAAQRAQERLTRLEAAFAVLSDAAQRKRYDAECLSPEEHSFHMARRGFIKDLHEFAHELAKREASGQYGLLCRAYWQMPHQHIESYFDSLQLGAHRVIRSNMAALQTRPLINAAQELMNDEKWAPARELLRVVLAISGPSGRTLYYLAVCELKLEEQHIEKQLAPSGPGVAVVVGAKRRLQAMAEKRPATEDAPEALKRLLADLLRRKNAGQAQDSLG